MSKGINYGIEEWLVLKLRDKDQMPAVDGLKVEIKGVPEEDRFADP